MHTADIIRRKRDGGELTQAEIGAFIDGYVRGSVPDYQAAAWCMAVFFRGMTPAEITWLTEAMAASGEMLDLHDVAPFIVDKHSSGGVGDKTTLVVGPMVASLGLPVAKMSGRGLSFSGGTLDKLESIPGFRVDLTVEQFKHQLHRVGLVVAGQSRALAPADAKLYALRDVTGTVDSMPLIASSIMSKKIAAGADAIVLDVKVGAGAFMRTVAEADELARIMMEIARRSGRRVTTLIADMSQPLGCAVGNALEVVEAIETLRNSGPPDLRDHCIEVAGEMLLISDMADGPASARAKAAAALRDGAAWSKFCEFVAAQGGDVRSVQDPSLLPRAPVIAPLTAVHSGTIAGVDARAVGEAVVALGGGRERKADPIAPDVGVVLSRTAKVGDKVSAGDTLLWIHARSLESVGEVEPRLREAFSLTDEPVTRPPLIHRILR